MLVRWSLTLERKYRDARQVAADLERKYRDARQAAVYITKVPRCSPGGHYHANESKARLRWPHSSSAASLRM